MKREVQKTIVLKLLEKGADFNLLDKHGYTPLGYASHQFLKEMDLLEAIVYVAPPAISSQFDNNTLFT